MQKCRVEIRYVPGVGAEVTYWVYNVNQIGTSTAGVTGGQLLDAIGVSFGHYHGAT